MTKRQVSLNEVFSVLLQEYISSQLFFCIQFCLFSRLRLLISMRIRVGLVRGRLGYEDWIVRYVEEYGETGLSDKRLELYVATAHYRTPLCVGVVVTKPDLANGPRERTTQTSCSSLGSVC